MHEAGDGRKMISTGRRSADPVAIPQGAARPDAGRGANVVDAFAWLRERLPLSRRADLTESLDGDSIARRELDTNLADLARLGRLPGGESASVAAIRRLVPASTGISILDIGAGRGDMALAFARQGWRTVAVDSHAMVLDAARARTSVEPLVEVVEADGRALPYPDNAFDVGHCSLLMHHLDPPDGVALLRELARVSRAGIVVNDLRRGWLAFVMTGVAVAVLGRCRATRVDGLISARRAYTVAELGRLIEAAGLELLWRSPALMPRVVFVAGPRQ